MKDLFACRRHAARHTRRPPRGSGKSPTLTGGSDVLNCSAPHLDRPKDRSSRRDSGKSTNPPVQTVLKLVQDRDSPSVKSQAAAPQFNTVTAVRALRNLMKFLALSGGSPTDVSHCRNAERVGVCIPVLWVDPVKCFPKMDDLKTLDRSQQQAEIMGQVGTASWIPGLRPKTVRVM